MFHVVAQNLTILVPHLIQMGYDPTHRNLKQEGLLHAVCNHAVINSKDISQVYETIDCVRTHCNWSDVDKWGRTPLFAIAKMYEQWNNVPANRHFVQDFDLDTVSLIQRAIGDGADINHCDCAGNTYASQTTCEKLMAIESLVQKQNIEKHLPNEGNAKCVVRKM